MAKWRVYVPVSTALYLGTFEADTAEEAVELGLAEMDVPSLCHQCVDRLGDSPQPVDEQAFAEPEDAASPDPESNNG